MTQVSVEGLSQTAIANISEAIQRSVSLRANGQIQSYSLSTRNLFVNGIDVVAVLNTLITTIWPQCVSSQCGPYGFGAILSNNDCQCICAPEWTGDACDQHECGNGGTFDSDTKKCTCQGPYTPESFCFEKESAPEYIYNYYECPPGVIGVCGTIATDNCILHISIGV